MSDARAARQTLAILELLARRPGPLPAATIAGALRIPRSSTYRLLGVLRDAGFVTHLGDERRFGLGPATFELGAGYLRQEPMRWLAATALARLVQTTGHNGHLAVLHGRDVLYLIEQRAPNRPSLISDVGVRLPATLTASGLAMIAALPRAQIRALFPSRAALVAYDGRGPRSLAELDRLIAATRRDGYATEDGFITPGLASVGAAILDHGGHPVAAVSLTFLDGTVAHAEAADQVLDAAAAIAQQIHGTPASRAS